MRRLRQTGALIWRKWPFLEKETIDCSVFSWCGQGQPFYTSQKTEKCSSCIWLTLMWIYTHNFIASSQTHKNIFICNKSLLAYKSEMEVDGNASLWPFWAIPNLWSLMNDSTMALTHAHLTKLHLFVFTVRLLFIVKVILKSFALFVEQKLIKSTTM